MPKTRTYLGLDLSDREARYVLLRVSSDGAQVEQADVVSLNGEGASLEALLRRLTPRPSGVVCALSLESAAIRPMLLPPATQDNLEAMIGLEAEQMLPLQADDLSLGYQVYGVNDQSRLEVMLVAARQGAVERTLQRVNVMPWVSAVASLQGLCIANAALHDDPGLARQNVVLAVANRHGTELVSLFGGRVRAARFLGLSEGLRPTDGALPLAARNHLAQDIQRTVQALSYESGQTVDRVLVSGPLAGDDGLREQISEASGVPCVAWAPQALAEAAPWQRAPEFAVAYGAALQAAGLAETAINLTPQRITERREARRLQQRRIAWLTLAVSTVASCIALYYSSMHVKREQLQHLTQQYARLQQEAEEKQVPLTPGADQPLAAARAAIEAATFRPVSAIETLEALNQDLPPNVWLSDLAYKSDSNAVLRGYATEVTGPDALQLTLLTRPIFQNVSLDYRNLDTLNDATVWSFQITLRFPEAEEQPARGRRR